MITQCPKCQKMQDVPEPYRGKEVKCLGCKGAFSAVEYRDPEEPREVILTPEPEVGHPENAPIPWRIVMFTAIQIAAVGWFVAAIIHADQSVASNAYQYNDGLMRSVYERIVWMHYDLRFFGAAIQYLLSGCLFCLAQIAKR
jgi:hypothetical protein